MGWFGASLAEFVVSNSLSSVKKALEKDREAGFVLFQDLVEFVNDKTTLLDRSVRQAGMKTL